MEKMDAKSGLMAEKEKPVPPALPGPFATSYRQKGLVMNGSTLRGHCCVSTAIRDSWDRLFDEGYRADVSIHTENNGVIYAHASILGIVSPVLKRMLKQSRVQNRRRSITIRGVPHEAVRAFIRFLYSSCYEEEEMKTNALHLLVLSHVYVVPQLKRLCEWWMEQGLLTVENVVDIFQLALLCDAPRLGLICHRMILKNLKAVSATEGWEVMKKSHPVLERQLWESASEAKAMEQEGIKKSNEKKIYLQLYEAMEALVYICWDNCRTFGSHNKDLKAYKGPCNYEEACKGLASLVRHLSKCKLRVPGGCTHCKRMWQLLELHARLCANSDACKVPLCRDFKQRLKKQNKKDDIKWKILVTKILRTKSITGAPLFTLAYT